VEVTAAKSTGADREGGGALRGLEQARQSALATSRSPPRLSGSIVINGACFYSRSFLIRDTGLVLGGTDCNDVCRRMAKPVHSAVTEFPCVLDQIEATEWRPARAIAVRSRGTRAYASRR
jgi:hypothetical protein